MGLHLPGIRAIFGDVRETLRWAVMTAVVAMTAASGCKSRSSSSGTSDPHPEPSSKPSGARVEFDVFAFAEVLGTIAPCGCTTEPLGGLQFALGSIETTPSAQRLVVEPGSFLFPHPEGPLWPTDDAGWTQAYDRAAVLHGRFSALGDRLVSGVGPTDVGSPQGPSALKKYDLPRVVANAEGLGRPRSRVVGLEGAGVRWEIGVTAVVDPGAPGVEALGALQDPIAALPEVVAAMRTQGADLVLVLAQGRRQFAEAVAAGVPGLDVVVVGQPQGVDNERLGASMVRQGETFILEPGNGLQTMSVLHLSVDASLSEVPPPGAWAVTPSRGALTAELERVTSRLAKFEADPEADAAFLERLRQEREGLQAKLEGEDIPGPVVATFEQRKVTCKLPVDAAGAQALAAYEAKVSTANEARFRGVKAPPVRPGQAGYVGTDACADCHEESVTFWQTTRHAGAYATLVDGNKQYDLTCVGCHVTGYRKPGGSEVVENAGLQDVQCEVCHGPGSLHVDDGGDDLTRIVRDAPAELCATECHTPEHSDTFLYEAYLRDILGPGHGEAKRAHLGPGTTGRELRAAGLAAAGGSCKEKMMVPLPR